MEGGGGGGGEGVVEICNCITIESTTGETC